jgi:hypothetical protein
MYLLFCPKGRNKIAIHIKNIKSKNLQLNLFLPFIIVNLLCNFALKSLAVKLKLAYILIVVFLLTSCKNNNEQQRIESQKDVESRALVFEKINTAWIFNAKPSNTTAQASIVNWNEWRLFLSELNQKPQKTISDFKQKSTELSQKVSALNNNIPPEFDKPQIKSRISALITKVRLLDLYLHLNTIPAQKVVALVSQINEELLSLQNQMDKLVQKSKIPLEEGESDLLRMLDTTRAIPNEIIDTNTPRVE